jgi:hypothetical protein
MGGPLQIILKYKRENLISQTFIEFTHCLSGGVLVATERPRVSKINFCSLGPLSSVKDKRINVSIILITTNSENTTY